jgi:hypothetical protein
VDAVVRVVPIGRHIPAQNASRCRQENDVRHHDNARGQHFLCLDVDHAAIDGNARHLDWCAFLDHRARHVLILTPAQPVAAAGDYGCAVE